MYSNTNLLCLVPRRGRALARPPLRAWPKRKQACSWRCARHSTEPWVSSLGFIMPTLSPKTSLGLNVGAAERTRTSTGLLPLEPESSVSTIPPPRPILSFLGSSHFDVARFCDDTGVSRIYLRFVSTPPRPTKGHIVLYYREGHPAQIYSIPASRFRIRCRFIDHFSIP